ncbi:MAG: sulfatase-like hydrolase/transferase, partial [Verrucomicrobiales bacterium]
MKRNLLLLFVSLSWLVVAHAEQSERRPPNIVLIFADDVGREVLGCYGGESYRTPNLDQLRADGMKLEHFYSSPVCHPSRVTLMSGRYPVNMGSPKWGYYPTGEASERETLGNEMNRAGYATVAAGKWHLAMFKKDLDHPQRLGFDESIFFGWHEGPRFHDPYLYKNGQRPDPETKGQFGPELYVKFLKKFMEE